MTGASFEVVFDDAPFQGMFERVEAALGDSSALLRVIGEYGVRSTQDRFHIETAPDGSAWAPLSPSYAAMKGSGHNTLYLSGDLLKTQHWEAGFSEVSWGSGMIYAAVHQFGATIVPKTARALVFKLGIGGARTIFAKSVTIPARPYLGLNAEDRDEIVLLAEDYIGRLIRGD